MCLRQTIELEKADDSEVLESGRKALVSTAVKRVVVMGPVGFEVVQYTVSQIPDLPQGCACPYSLEVGSGSVRTNRQSPEVQLWMI